MIIISFWYGFQTLPIKNMPDSMMHDVIKNPHELWMGYMSAINTASMDTFYNFYHLFRSGASEMNTQDIMDSINASQNVLRLLDVSSDRIDLICNEILEDGFGSHTNVACKIAGGGKKGNVLFVTSFHGLRDAIWGIIDHHCFLPVEYYQKALSFFPEQDYNVLVFTDNFPWVKENIKGPNIYYNEWGPEHKRPDFIDLYMMSLCDHHIIANSSFSWWGAYLANKKDQVVVAPTQWFGPSFAHLITTDTVPPTWIRI